MTIIIKPNDYMRITDNVIKNLLEDVEYDGPLPSKESYGIVKSAGFRPIAYIPSSDAAYELIFDCDRYSIIFLDAGKKDGEKVLFAKEKSNMKIIPKD